MSFDPFGGGGNGSPFYGRRAPSFLQSVIQGVLGGANAYGRTRIAVQDRQRQQQLQDEDRAYQNKLRPIELDAARLRLKNAQDAANESQQAPYAEALGSMEPEYPESADLRVRRAMVRSNAYHVDPGQPEVRVWDQSQLKPTDSSFGEEGITQQARPSNLLTGVTLGRSRSQIAQDLETQRTQGRTDQARTAGLLRLLGTKLTTDTRQGNAILGQRVKRANELTGQGYDAASAWAQANAEVPGAPAYDLGTVLERNGLGGGSVPSGAMDGGGGYPGAPAAPIAGPPGSSPAGITLPGAGQPLGAPADPSNDMATLQAVIGKLVRGTSPGAGTPSPGPSSPNVTDYLNQQTRERLNGILGPAALGAPGGQPVGLPGVLGAALRGGPPVPPRAPVAALGAAGAPGGFVRGDAPVSFGPGEYFRSSEPQPATWPRNTEPQYGPQAGGPGVEPQNGPAGAPSGPMTLAQSRIRRNLSGAAVDDARVPLLGAQTDQARANTDLLRATIPVRGAQARLYDAEMRKADEETRDMREKLGPYLDWLKARPEEVKAETAWRLAGIAQRDRSLNQADQELALKVGREAANEWLDDQKLNMAQVAIANRDPAKRAQVEATRSQIDNLQKMFAVTQMDPDPNAWKKLEGIKASITSLTGKLQGMQGQVPVSGTPPAAPQFQPTTRAATPMPGGGGQPLAGNPQSLRSQYTGGLMQTVNPRTGRNYTQQEAEARANDQVRKGRLPGVLR